MLEQVFKNVDDVLWKEAGCTTELDYTEQTSWLLFLKYLDALEQDRADEARLKGKNPTWILEREYRWEEWAVFVGRITPVMRSFISVPAGLFRARFGPYVWLTLLGSALWCFAFAGAGWAAGASWEQFHHAFRFVDYVVAVLVVGVAAAVVWRFVKRRREPRADRADEPI